MTLFNEVYEIYKSCTPCVDYPTYQDGYFKGNDGTEDGYLINQVRTGVAAFLLPSNTYLETFEI